MQHICRFPGVAGFFSADLFHHTIIRNVTSYYFLQVWEGRWRVIPFDVLPDWLKDNDYLLHGHRPPMPSFRACFKSIFRIHTETGNIWTHLLGTLDENVFFSPFFYSSYWNRNERNVNIATLVILLE